MNYAPLARIVLRYGVGLVFAGSGEIGQHLSTDPDIVSAVALGIGFLVETTYALAKRKGWAT